MSVSFFMEFLIIEEIYAGLTKLRNNLLKGGFLGKIKATVHFSNEHLLPILTIYGKEAKIQIIYDADPKTQIPRVVRYNGEEVPDFQTAFRKAEDELIKDLLL